jgi:hypothetical protein
VGVHHDLENVLEDISVLSFPRQFPDLEIYFHAWTPSADMMNVPEWWQSCCFQFGAKMKESWTHWYLPAREEAEGFHSTHMQVYDPWYCPFRQSPRFFGEFSFGPNTLFFITQIETRSILRTMLNLSSKHLQLSTERVKIHKENYTRIYEHTLHRPPCKLSSQSKTCKHQTGHLAFKSQALILKESG